MSSARDELTQRFVDRHGDECACVPMNGRQRAWYAGILIAFLAGLAYRWDVVICLANIVLAFWYFSIILFRTLTVLVAFFRPAELRVGREEQHALRAEDLPVYTILVPLYHETAVAAKIVRSLESLDYPHDKLDIKLLLEPDDPETLDCVRRAGLGSHFDVIVVPDSLPKTKPKACNYGLERAKGAYCVIYDAEDRPDPDQLRKVVVAFGRAGPELACIQARLNFFNAEQNLLTRWFTIEYSTTFDLFLPGLQTAGVPIPLGGTSNHFRTEVLRQLNGWDPYNVTEDCDLGVRLYRAGFRTAMIESTTWEEANSELWNWIRQRSRWVKGFFQTHLVHTRHPWRMLRQLGVWGAFGFYLNVGASSLMMVLNLVYWVITAFYLSAVAEAMRHGHSLMEVVRGPRESFRESLAWPMVYYGPNEDALWSSLSVAFFVIACILLAANLLFVLMHILACVRRRFWRLLPYALLMPVYWVLISIGACKGFGQFLTRPFYWEKTRHGLCRAGGDGSGGG